MSKYISRRFVTVPLAVVAIAIAGCSKDKTDTLAQDSTLSADMALANRDSAAQPQLTDVPATTPPAATTPSRSSSASTPARTSTSTKPTTSTPSKSTTKSGNTVTSTPGGSATRTGTIAAGTTLNLTSNSRVCTNTNKVGDHVTATVANAVTGSNGVSIPAGATANVEVTELKRSENAKDKVVMGFRVRSVTFGGKTYPVAATVSSAQVDLVKNQPKGKDAQKVATGAVVGAVVGQIIGKSTKSTVIGGAIGAAAGAGAAATTSNYEGCVPDGGRITVVLDNAMQVQG